MLDELRLIEAADDIETRPADLTEALAALRGWMSGLEAAMTELRLELPRGLCNTHPIASAVRRVNELLEASAETWASRWRALQPAHAVAASFDDRVMLLVFGKFNAGKSSLCNALADRFVANGRAVQFFHVEDGRVAPTTSALREGATETTSTLQGICLGDGLVLLDTPGLHSMTLENAALTRCFTDSADALLWLTASTSPGQVQELDELARELHRDKPLLPVITRSDVVEEDEVDGELVHRLRNKSPDNRASQEGDVRERALGKLVRMGVPTSLLRPPISLSARMAREQEYTPAALLESGLDRLCAALLSLIEPALAYKRRKPVEVLLHHLEEAVAGAIAAKIQPALGLLVEDLTRERDRLLTLQARLGTVIWRQVASEVSTILESQGDRRNIPEACRRLAGLLTETVAREMASRLGEWDVSPSAGDEGSIVELDAQEMRDVAAASATASGTVDEAPLHEALQRAVRRALAGKLDAVFVPPVRVLDEIQSSNRVLQEALTSQVGSLQALKCRWRAELR